MQKHGYQSLDDFRSLLVDEVKTADAVTLYGGYARIKEPNLSGPCKVACPQDVYKRQTPHWLGCPASAAPPLVS